MIHPVADEVIRTGRITRPDGTVLQAHSAIPQDECDLLYEVVELAQATHGVEVGMAFAVSTVCLGDALRRRAGAEAKLVVFDPTQTRADSWNGTGVLQVERAGLTEVVELREETSQEGLPKLLASGYRCQVAFIDGWHTFDHTLVDFFYVDRMLEAGGYVVFDDVGYQAIHAVVRFVLANRDYELVRALHQNVETSAVLRAKRRVKGFLRRFARTDRDPVAHERLFRELVDAHSVALRKRSDDARRFDHYFPF
jgi:predicted O-methyltransferase YrrM